MGSPATRKSSSCRIQQHSMAMWIAILFSNCNIMLCNIISVNLVSWCITIFYNLGQGPSKKVPSILGGMLGVQLRNTWLMDSPATWSKVNLDSGCPSHAIVCAFSCLTHLAYPCCAISELLIGRVRIKTCPKKIRHNSPQQKPTESTPQDFKHALQLSSNSLDCWSGFGFPAYNTFHVR